MKCLLTCLWVGSFVFSGCDSPGNEEQSAEVVEASLDQLPEKLTPEEERFLELVREGFRSGDSTELVKRICWDGVAPSHHRVMGAYLEGGVGRGYESLEFERVDPELLTRRKEGENTVVENLPVQWKLVVHHESDGFMEISSEFLLGLKDGEILFTNAIAESR